MSILSKHFAKASGGEHAAGSFLRSGLSSLGAAMGPCAYPACSSRDPRWPRWLQRWDWIELSGKRYCAQPCAAIALAEEIERHCVARKDEPEGEHRLPLGLLLISHGWINQSALQEALRRQQREEKQRLGSLLVKMGALSEANLTLALAMQWGCAAFPFAERSAIAEQSADKSNVLPSAILEWASVMPIHASADRRVLHLAFRYRVDHSLLYALEQMLEWRVQPCVAPDRLVDEALGRLQNRRRMRETVFDGISDPYEMAEIAIGKARKLHTDSVQVTTAAGSIWLRLASAGHWHDLLFPTPKASEQERWQTLSPSRAHGSPL